MALNNTVWGKTKGFIGGLLLSEYTDDEALVPQHIVIIRIPHSKITSVKTPQIVYMCPLFKSVNFDTLCV